MAKSYSPERLEAIRLHILQHLRSGPVARVDLPELVDATEYIATKILKPLVRSGAVRTITRKRLHDRPPEWGGPRETRATFYVLTARGANDAGPVPTPRRTHHDRR